MTQKSNLILPRWSSWATMVNVCADAVLAVGRIQDGRSVANRNGQPPSVLSCKLSDEITAIKLSLRVSYLLQIGRFGDVLPSQSVGLVPKQVAQLSQRDRATP